jgi:hypothetical protein
MAVIESFGLARASVLASMATLCLCSAYVLYYCSFVLLISFQSVSHFVHCVYIDCVRPGSGRGDKTEKNVLDNNGTVIKPRRMCWIITEQFLEILVSVADTPSICLSETTLFHEGSIIFYAGHWMPVHLY